MHYSGLIINWLQTHAAKYYLRFLIRYCFPTSKPKYLKIYLFYIWYTMTYTCVDSCKYTFNNFKHHIHEKQHSWIKRVYINTSINDVHWYFTRHYSHFLAWLTNLIEQFSRAVIFSSWVAWIVGNKRHDSIKVRKYWAVGIAEDRVVMSLLPVLYECRRAAVVRRKNYSKRRSDC